MGGGSEILSLSETFGGLSRYEGIYSSCGSYGAPETQPDQILLFPGEAEAGDLGHEDTKQVVGPYPQSQIPHYPCD